MEFHSDLRAFVSSWFHHLTRPFRRSRVEREMAEEMRAHLEEQTLRNIAAGMNENDARAAAHRQFGGVAQIQERARDGRGIIWLENLVRDTGFAVRTLRKSPGFTSVVVLTLALGLGVNTALFTWFNAAAFRPLPVLQPEELVTVKRLDARGNETKAMSYLDFVAYRDHRTVLSGLAAYARHSVVPLDLAEGNTAGGTKPEALNVETVSANYFSVFGVPMVLGRSLVAADETGNGALPVIVLGHRFWQNAFGGDPNVIGRTLRLSGLTEEALTIVGVTGPEFCGTSPNVPAGWVPLALLPGDTWRTDPKATGLTLTGRLRAGLSREQAAAELQVIAREFLARRGADPVRPEVITLARASTFLNLTPQMLPVLLPMVALFGAVLLVACANASNLILARTVTRQFEFAVRSALGATRRRLFALLMTESVVLSTLGGIVGWAFSAGLMRFVWPWLVSMIPGAREGTAGLQLHADHRVFVFILVVSMLAGVAGGLWPALRVARRNVASALNHDGSAFGRRVRVSHVRGTLAIAQLALSSALVFTAGLLVHRALATQFKDVGFDRSRLITFSVTVPRAFGPEQINRARGQALARVRALPEVAATCEMTRFPFERLPADVSVPATDQVDARTFNIVHASVPANYFDTVPLPLVRGRSFASDETPNNRVAVISESAAQRFWPGRDALGQRLEVPAEARMENETTAVGPVIETTHQRVTVTIVGVARDTTVYDPWSGDRSVVYLPATTSNLAPPFLLIRTSGPADQSLAALQEIGRDVTGLNPRILTVDDLYANVFIQYRVIAWVAGILAGLSLLVAVIGLYGVMAFTVNQRVKEIGIRIALGATPVRVASEVMFHSLRLVATGAAAGFGLSLLIAGVARTLLFGVAAFEPVASGAVALFLAVVGLVACWAPARRASSVDPIVALRAE